MKKRRHYKIVQTWLKEFSRKVHFRTKKYYLNERSKSTAFTESIQKVVIQSKITKFLSQIIKSPRSRRKRTIWENIFKKALQNQKAIWWMNCEYKNYEWNDNVRFINVVEDFAFIVKTVKVLPYSCNKSTLGKKTIKSKVLLKQCYDLYKLSGFSIMDQYQ